MTISAVSLRTLAGAVALGLLAPACIITTSEDDGDVEETGGDDDTPPSTTGLPSDGTTAVPDGTTGEPGDDTTGGTPEVCPDAENLVLDPGFEGGTPSPAWTEASELFGTPICDIACQAEGETGAAPNGGDWWVWFGGLEMPDTASVSQVITISPDMAYLSFYFQVRSGAGTGDDTFTATLGGDTVFMATDLDRADYDGYERVDIDVSQWADGGSYELVFAANITGNGLTSFFLDDVSLVACGDEGGTETGTTGETDGQDDTTAGTTTGDTDGTTAGTTDGGTTDAGTTGGTG